MSKFLKNNFLVLIALCLGAILRLYRIPEYINFLGDEGRDAIAAYNIVHGHLTLLGPTSSVGGFFLGPIYYYFMAPFLWLFNYHPVGPAVMVALLGVATIGLIYYVGKEFFGKKAGLIAAFLYSIAPIVIVYSRSSWNPNVMPFFSLLTLYLLYKATEKRKPFLLVLCGILFGITMQLHYIAVFLGVIIFLYITVIDFLRREKINNLVKNLFKDYINLFLGFLVGLSPFLLFEARHGFLNINNIVKFIFFSGETGAGPGFVNTILLVSTRFFGGLLFNFPITSLHKDYPSQSLNIWLLFSLIIGILCLTVIIKQMLDVQKTSDRFKQLFLIFLWSVLGIFLFGFYKKSIYDYYLVFVFPLPFLLLGNLVSKLTNYKSNDIRSVILTLFGVSVIFIGIVSAVVLSPLRLEPNNQVTEVSRIAEFVVSKTDNKPFNFALLSLGNSDHAYRYFFKLWHRDPVVIEPSFVDPDRKTVTDQLLVICDYKCSPLGNPLWEVAGFGEAQIAGEWDIYLGKVYKLVHSQKKPLP